jgi:hypothetical protein
MRKAQDGIDRRKFLLAGAAGAASVAGVGGGISAVVAQQAGAQGPRTNSPTGIRTAVITDTQLNIGPYLARKMAVLGYNLVIADVQKGLPEELRNLGAAEVVVVEGLEQDGPNNESKPGSLR